jgi:hypothetical protein
VKEDEDDDDDDKAGEEDEVMNKRGSAMDEDLVQYSTHVRQPFFEFVRLWQQHAGSLSYLLVEHDSAKSFRSI